MFSFLYTSPNNDIQYDKNNPTHVSRIKDEIIQFTKILSALKEKDTNSLGLTTLVTTSASFINIYIVAILAFLTAKYAFQTREENAKAYHASLRQLIQTYKWCTQKGAESTFDPVVIELTETLAPYMKLKDLLYWEKTPQDDSSLNNTAITSVKFNAILAKPPHNHIRTVETKPSSLFGNFFGSIKPSQPKVEQKDLNQQKTIQGQIHFVIEQASSSIRASLYGDSDQEEKPSLLLTPK